MPKQMFSDFVSEINQVIYSASPISSTSFKFLAPICFAISYLQDFIICFFFFFFFFFFFGKGHITHDLFSEFIPKYIR